MRYAAIDIGSNAIRMLIAEVNQTGKNITFKKNSLIRVPLRLGDDAFLDKKISQKKATDLLKTMSAFSNLMDVYKVSDYMACATSAMREAVNGSKIVTEIKDKTHINLEIISGQREASLIYASNINEQIDPAKNYLYIDVGGGSTELSFFSAGKPQVSQSFNIGTIRMLDNQDKEETWQEMKDWIKTHSKTFKNLYGIGTGGNINKIFRMSEEKDGTALSLTKLKSIAVYLNSFSLKDRITILGLNQDRADVIIPACEIYLNVMKWGGVKSIYVPRVGLVDGIIQLLIDKKQVQ